MAFGEILKQKRLEHGWTREYIAERMNMRTCFVEMLETENLKRIVAPAYGRGYIRNYCRELGIDPQPLVADYNALLAAEGAAADRGPVSHPVVRGLPEKPHEPIHTGAHRTLPPKEGPKVTTAASGHKLVASAEALFTAVPKPEMPPVSVEPEPPQPARAPEEPAAPAAEEPFTLQGDTLPQAAKAAPPLRSALASLVTEQPPRHQVPRPLPERAETPHTGASIFGPQHPVKDPTSPWMATCAAIGKRVSGCVVRVVQLAHRPKVRRLADCEERFWTPRRMAQALVMLGLLLCLTLFIFAFRYVFRMSAAAESEASLSEPAATVFSPRPVAPPPAPYFK